jgi:hypothetical protein
VLHNRTEKFIFEAWCCASFAMWGWSWQRQDELAFALTFLLGFLPPAVVIVLTANRTLLRLLHKEFTLWFTLGNMVGFCAVMPYLCEAPPHVLSMQIAGMVYCAWLFCALDCVQLSGRFEAIFGLWLLFSWGFLYYSIQVCVRVQCACSSPGGFCTTPSRHCTHSLPDQCGYSSHTVLPPPGQARSLEDSRGQDDNPQHLHGPGHALRSQPGAVRVGWWC